MTSVASYLAWPNAGGYIAARHALRGVTEALRTELNGTGVTVAQVALGTVDARIGRTIRAAASTCRSRCRGCCRG